MTPSEIQDIMAEYPNGVTVGVLAGRVKMPPEELLKILQRWRYRLWWSKCGLWKANSNG